MTIQSYRIRQRTQEVFAAVLYGLNRAGLLPLTNGSTALVHTVRIPTDSQAFLPDSLRRWTRRHPRQVVARLLCADSSYTLFQWPHPIPESGHCCVHNCLKETL